MATKAKTTKLIRDLNAKFGAGTWRTRVLHSERQVERRRDGRWEFWGWDDNFNVDSIRRDYLADPNVRMTTD